jgi:DNA-binding winged helix-turn-helix (wHTH) protein
MKTATSIKTLHQVSVTSLFANPTDFDSFVLDEGHLPSPRISEMQFEGFQIALVPLNVLEPRAPVHRQTENHTRRLLVLPLTWQQLMAHLRTEMGPPQGHESSVVRFGDVTVNLVSMEVFRSEQRVPMTAMEFKVLRYFVLNPNRAISRDRLLDKVWGYDHYPCTRTVDNHILRLRQKLEADMAKPMHFSTVHGVGYKFTP